MVSCDSILCAATFVVTVYREFFGEPNSSPHEVSGETPIDKEVWCMDLQFHLEAFQFMMIYVKKIDLASSPRPPLPPFFSLTIPKQQYKKKEKKQQEQVTKSFYWRKTSACRIGTLKKQPN